MSNDPNLPEPRPLDLPLDEWQIGVEKAALGLPGRVGHCARNSFNHLRKAWRLYAVDNEMAAFRMITAEEEAATAVIHALQAQKYTGSKQLNPRNHVHKCALWPIVRAVSNVLHKTDMPLPKVFLTVEGKPKVVWQLNLNALTRHEGEPIWAEPDHPLNFLIRTGDASEEIVHMFEEEFAELATLAGANSIRKHSESEANVRNQLLYANDIGIPSVAFSDDLIRSRTKRVAVLITLAIVVLQTPTHQLFVSQCLEALLRALEKIGDASFDYSSAKLIGDRPLLKIDGVGKESRMSIRTKVKMNIFIRWDRRAHHQWVANVKQVSKK